MFISHTKRKKFNKKTREMGQNDPFPLVNG